MPTTTAQQILDDVELVLQDTTNIRWTVAELLGWLNAGQAELVINRPDASSVVASMPLVAGTRQTIPAAGHMLLDVVRNMGSGSTPGRSVRKTSTDQLDSTVPNWHSAAQAAETLHYTFDPRTPRVFYVYPPANGSTQVEIKYSAAPTRLNAAGDVITVDDIYRNALMDYVLYRAYSKDFELSGNMERATFHYTRFRESLGLKTQTDAALVPSDRSKG